MIMECLLETKTATILEALYPGYFANSIQDAVYFQSRSTRLAPAREPLENKEILDPTFLQQ